MGRCIDHCISDLLTCTHHPLGCVSHIDYVLVLFSSEKRHSHFLAASRQTSFTTGFYSSIVPKQHIFGDGVNKACISDIHGR